MKVLTKEEENAHYRATLRGGISGGALGLGVGLGAAWLMNSRFPFFRSLTLPLKAFFVSSSGTFAAIIAADRASRGFESDLHHPGEAQLLDRQRRIREQKRAGMTEWQKAMEFGRENRYTIVGASWLASMGASLGFVWRDKYLTRAQKLVQARVYAQGLTLLVLIASAAFEVSDARYKKEEMEWVPDPRHPGKMIEKRVHHEMYKGEDMWKEMVESEENRLNKLKEAREAKAKQAE